jgi:DNA-binding NtrC family response regulator
MATSEIRVLVVEDDDDMRLTLKEFISKMGVKVCTAGTVADAKRSLRAEADPFDLVLTDLKLPDGSGMDVLADAHARSAETLVTIVTGYASLETAIEAIRLGAYDYLTKPFSLDEIGVQVRNMIERASLSKENARLSIRLQELYEKVNRLQNERSDAARFQEEIRKELHDTSRKLDQLLASRPNLPGKVQTMVLHPDKTLVSHLFREMENLDSLKSMGSVSGREIEEKRRGLIQEFVDKL